jgi:hypothetical protein
MTHPTNPDGEVTVTDELKPGHCHKCGLQLSDNPHPEAGKPSHYLQVGCPKECIPCVTLSRHQWAGRAMKAENELTDARKLLSATQPAAVDREAVPVAWLIDLGAGSTVDRFQQVEPYGWQYDEVEKRGGSITPLYAAPLDKDASKSAAPYSAPFTTDVPQCCGDPSTCDDPCQHNDAPSVEQDERGDAPLSLIPELVKQDQRAVSDALLDIGDAMVAWRTEVGKYREITSLAQSAFSDGYEAGIAAILRARAASTSANVAQGAEAVAWESTTPVYRRFITDERYQRLSPESRRWYKPYRCPHCADAVPTAQPALTDAARDAIRCEAFNEACAAIKAEDDKQSDENYMLDSDDCIRVIRAMTAAQSASGDAK